VSYNNFKEKIISSEDKLTFFTKKDLELQIRDSSNSLKSSELDLLDIDDLDENSKEEFKEEYINNLKTEHSNLEKELEANESEIELIENRIKREKETDFSSKKDNEKEKAKKDSIEEIKILEEKLKALILRREKIQLFLNKKVEDIRESDSDIDNFELLSILNKNRLIKQIDELDPS
jgi:hypothetical protein